MLVRAPAEPPGSVMSGQLGNVGSYQLPGSASSPKLFLVRLWEVTIENSLREGGTTDKFVTCVFTRAGLGSSVRERPGKCPRSFMKVRKTFTGILSCVCHMQLRTLHAG
jgi:hypothetical protein